MKFPKLHHERILEIIKSSGMNIEDFFFVKRKGWIRIEHIETQKYFTYFKVKETKIDPVSHQWENNMYFKIKTSESKDRQEPTFDLMISRIDEWLKGLK